ncbi:MAG TPA: RsmD family RNA methyltransferase, partial [Mycobacteriales bacterium]
VEKARPAQAAIRANIADLAATEVSLVAADAVAFSASPGGAFDVVVADPPYALPAVELAGILAALHAGGRLAADAVIVVERAWRDGPFPFPEGLAADRSRRYGDTIVCYGHAL